MTSTIDSIINRQLHKWELEQSALTTAENNSPTIPPIITISRQKGSRGSYFASRLSEQLDYTLLHRKVIDRICLSSGFRKQIVESLDTRFRSQIEIMVETFITGQSIDHSDYFRHLYHTVLAMSKLGGVILVGRGGNFILGRKNGFHIRFIAPKEKRIENLINYKLLSKDEAVEKIETSDKLRSEFIQKLFGEDIDNPKHYDLVINAEYIDIEELIAVAEKAMFGKFEKLKHLGINGNS